MKTIHLTDEQAETLLLELHSLYGYHWRDETKHAFDCGSVIVDEIQSQINQQKYSDLLAPDKGQ